MAYILRLAAAILLIFAAVQIAQSRILGYEGPDLFLILFELGAYFLAMGLNVISAFGLLTNNSYGIYVAYIAVLLTTWPSKIAYLPLEQFNIYFPHQILIINFIFLISIFLVRPKVN